jgi:hypothetical protein
LELYNKRISNKILIYRDNTENSNSKNNTNDDANNKDLIIANDTCCHHYVQEVQWVIECIKKIENSLCCTGRASSVLIFYPYLKQMRNVLLVLKQNFNCCITTIEKMQTYVNNVVSHCLLCMEQLKSVVKSLYVMNVFMVDDIVIYECDVCKEMSNDVRFLKPKECCDFSLCNGCCVKMWKTASTHAKCPACRTSFKSSSIVLNK